LLVDWKACAQRLCDPDHQASHREDMTLLRQACLARAHAMLRSFRLPDADVEDLVQDFLAAKLEELARDDLESPETFFCVCLRRAALDAVRTAKRRRDLLAREGPPRNETNASAIEDVFARARLQRAFAEVPERQRAIFWAAIEGEDREAIGRAFHTSRANVDQIVRRTRQLLLRVWNEQEEPRSPSEGAAGS
jgi:RNA polymerase sigma factor (sigma-70 family)